MAIVLVTGSSGLIGTDAVGHFCGLGHTVLGITTDGSALYPVPISLAFGAIPHQICEFHVLKQIESLFGLSFGQ